MTRIHPSRAIRVLAPAQPAGPSVTNTAGTLDAKARQFGALYEDACVRATRSKSRDDDPNGNLQGYPDNPEPGETESETSHGVATVTESLSSTLEATQPFIPPATLSPLPILSTETRALLANKAKPHIVTVRHAIGSGVQRKGRDYDRTRAFHQHEENDAQNAVATPSVYLQSGPSGTHVSEHVLLTSHIAERVASLCVNSVIRKTNPLEVRLTLDPAILPGAELHLHLSGSALSLRFSSTDPHARTLMYDNLGALDTRLRKLLDSDMSVIITVT